MFKITTKFIELGLLWKNTSNFFISYKFIDIFHAYHQNFRHLFIEYNKSLIYGHFFNISFEKTANYLNHFWFVKFFFRLFKIRTIFLTNSFFTNVNSFEIHDKIPLENLFITLRNKFRFFLIVIPDSLFVKLDTNYKHHFTKIEIEEDMFLDIDKEWANIEDYKNALKTKYRNRIKKIEFRSSQIEVKEISSNNFRVYFFEMKKLFNQVIKDSNFNGPEFNIETLSSMIQNKFCKVFAYFYNDKIIGFSSEIFHKNLLYSYYVGFDKKLNMEYSIYGKILLDTISNAIKHKKDRIIYGRTANEFKSNFGAKPISTYIYVRVQNYYINKILSFLFNKIKKKDWIIRQPFK